jgi:uncharacterized membrane protein YfcA
VNRANLVICAFFLAIALIGAHALAGNIDLGDIWRSAMVGIVYLVAVTAGARCFRSVSERAFRRVVLWLLLALAAVGVAT